MVITYNTNIPREMRDVASRYIAQQNLETSQPLVGEISELVELGASPEAVRELETKLANKDVINYKVGSSFVSVTHYVPPGGDLVLGYQIRAPSPMPVEHRGYHA